MSVGVTPKLAMDLMIFDVDDIVFERTELWL